MTPPTSVQNSAIFAPFTKGKNHRPLFAFFLKNATFFRPKKGPRTGLSHPLTRLTAIQFSDHAKSMAQITERIFNEAPSRCRPQKSIIFRRSRSTSVFLHCRMDRALRAIIASRFDSSLRVHGNRGFVTLYSSYLHLLYVAPLNSAFYQGERQAQTIL